MAMTEKQKAMLIKMIWDSELDYKEIKDRADALAPLSRTPEQEAEYQSYLAKLLHDRTTIAGWVTSLKQNGVPNVATAANLTIRLNTIDSLKNRENVEITKLDQTWNDFVISYAALPPERQNQEEYDNSLADYNRMKSLRQKRLTILDNLKTGTVWTL